MNEFVLFGVFVAFGLVVCLWIFIYQRLLRRLKELHPQKYASMHSSPYGRHNNMDAFFKFLQFVVLSEDRPLGDRVVSTWTLVLKFLFVVAFILMVTSALGPFFLPANWQTSP